jgi:glycosyltransferase involved in cell wall biosynthesis
LLYLINDTKIEILEKASSGSQGGTSSYLSGFINYLLKNHIEFNLIGNFDIIDGLKTNTHISHPATNLSFLKYLLKLFFVKKFDQKDVFYFQRPDHLACSLFSGRKKRILHLHGQPRTIIINKKNIITKSSYLLFERLAMHFSNLIFITDKKSASVYINKYPFIEKKLKVVPTGIDLNFFSESNDHSLKDKSKGRNELIYIGRLAAPKQVLEMLRAFQILSGKVSNCHFSIAGTGPLLIGLKEAVIKMGQQENVSFLGLLSKIQIRELIYKCDAAILLSGNEGSPISIKEVLACGKPVIVNDVGDLTDYVIHNKNGYIVDAEKSEEVAAAIANAFENSKNMRQACISSMMQYDETTINQSTVEYIFDNI